MPRFELTNQKKKNFEKKPQLHKIFCRKKWKQLQLPENLEFDPRKTDFALSEITEALNNLDLGNLTVDNILVWWAAQHDYDSPQTPAKMIPPTPIKPKSTAVPRSPFDMNGYISGIRGSDSSDDEDDSFNSSFDDWSTHSTPIKRPRSTPVKVNMAELTANLADLPMFQVQKPKGKPKNLRKVTRRKGTPAKFKNRTGALKNLFAGLQPRPAPQLRQASTPFSRKKMSQRRNSLPAQPTPLKALLPPPPNFDTMPPLPMLDNPSSAQTVSQSKIAGQLTLSLGLTFGGIIGGTLTTLSLLVESLTEIALFNFLSQYALIALGLSAAGFITGIGLLAYTVHKTYKALPPAKQLPPPPKLNELPPPPLTFTPVKTPEPKQKNHPESLESNTKVLSQ